MNLASEFSPIVIVGLWNKGIFNPDWIGKYLLPKQKLNIEFPINIDGSPRISNEDLRIFVLGNKLNFTLIKPEDKNLENIEELALKVADYLPHTPVSAFGINFLFTADISTGIKKMLHQKDSDILRDMGADIQNEQVRHCFKFKNHLINLNIIQEKNTVKFDFNYHFDIKNLIEFKEKLNDNRILELKNDAISIIDEVYN